MPKKGRMTVLKRQREVRKAEKAAAKREKREHRLTGEASGGQVATDDDLAAYGFEIEAPSRGREPD